MSDLHGWDLIHSYGFTGEQYGDSTQLLFLRARYYNPADGRFQSRDTWGGDYNRPLSLNRWMYVEGNPVNYTDPTGLIREKEADSAAKIVRELRIYNVFVKVDWGFLNKSVVYRQVYAITVRLAVRELEFK